jgi:excisionase family DNA binding protein
MSFVSNVRRKLIRDSRTKRAKDYLTTTEFARLCGVSRFTIINWINEGKIGAVKTFGGHRRIPVTEAISFLEHFRLDASQNGENSIGPGSLGSCWEYRQKSNPEDECRSCRNCLVYGREVGYCFAIVRQFGNEVIHCGWGDCLNCDYFEQLFGSCDKISQSEQRIEEKRKGALSGKRHFLERFAYSVGRGVRGFKGRVAGIRDRFVGTSPHAKENPEGRPYRTG